MINTTGAIVQPDGSTVAPSTMPETEQAEPKVTFDEKQQEKINQLIREAQGRAAREVRSELEQTKQSLTELQAALEKTRAANTDIEDLHAESKRLKSLLQQKDQEIQKERGTANNIRKTVAIQGSAGKVGFIDVAQVSKLTEDAVKYDDATGRHVVLNEAGQPRLNSSFEPMTLDEFYAEFASKNPHLVRGDVKAGLGSTPSQRVDATKNGKYTVEEIFGPKADSAKANKLAKEDINEYRRMKDIARAKKLIQY